MQVAIRTDTSVAIGSGHLMRCLTLADQLRVRGASVVLLMRAPAGFSGLLAEHGVPCAGVAPFGPENRTDEDRDAASTAAEIRRFYGGEADWLVVDHYGLSARWERAVRASAHRIMVIDDLADRPHDCDLLLDQNYYADAAERYRGLVPPTCVLLLGPSYALLREEFHAAAQRLRDRTGTIRRVLVSFGSTDPTGETVKALTALASLGDTALEADIVMGANSPSLEQARDLCGRIVGLRLHVQTRRMADLMLAADLAIGAGGATTWERCTLGLPTLTVITAPNQRRTTEDLAALGAIWCLGTSGDVQPVDYARAIKEACADPARLRAMSQRSLRVMRHAGSASPASCHPTADAVFAFAAAPS